MRTRGVVWLWLLVAILALATVVVGAVAGYRADEASVAVGGEAAFGVPLWEAALWTLLTATALAAVAAIALTLARSGRVEVRQIAAPLALAVAGFAGAAVFLPLALLGVGGVAWLTARVAGIPRERAVA
ncbi:MAG: hypothetical protein ACK4MD_02580 [Demequina sp.]